MKVLRIVIITFIFISLLVFLNTLVAPKYKDDLIEGSLTSDYYKSSINHDVIILGDCEVYENISPVTIYETNGIKSYVRGNSQQMLWQSYYILEETLKYEKPKVVVLSVNAMRNGTKDINEAYNRLVIDKMKWSKSKVNIIRSSMGKDETFISYLIPILRYHSRIGELKKEDIEYLFKDKKVSYNGFLVNTGIKGVENLPTKRPLIDSNFDPVNIEYLDKIRLLCEDNDIKLVLIKAPSLYPYWYDEYEEYITNYANKNNLIYYNFLDDRDIIGLDYSVDTYDGGLHLNKTGADKLSKYLATKLEDDFNLSNKKDDKYFNDMLKEYKKIS